MPEQITKYPEVTIQVLKEGGARCGPGVQKQILTQCPSEQFCAFPSGEICVYGIAQIPQMTQVKTQELARVVCPPGRRSEAGFGVAAWPDAGTFGVTFALGLAVGAIALRIQRPQG